MWDTGSRHLHVYSPPTYIHTHLCIHSHLHAYSPPTYIHTHLCIHMSPPCLLTTYLHTYLGHVTSMSPPCLLTTYLHTYPPMYTHVTSMPTHSEGQKCSVVQCGPQKCREVRAFVGHKSVFTSHRSVSLPNVLQVDKL